MTPEAVMDLAARTFSTAFWISLPILGVSMGVGLVVAILQAATQIQEASLTFVPKLLGMGVALVLFGPWIIDKLRGFTVALITAMGSVGGGGLHP